jgi:hypothetical protein
MKESPLGYDRRMQLVLLLDPAEYRMPNNTMLDDMEMTITH